NPAANIKDTTVVCTSGAATGENCALKVVATNVKVKEGNNRFNMVAAASTIMRGNAPAVAVGQGDSGGPVGSDEPNRGSRDAFGIISSGTNPLGTNPPSCAPFNAVPKCYSVVFYADIKTVLRREKLALK